jgi:outer membrane protein OmpA-like peptidoglycan-associated protein
VGSVDSTGGDEANLVHSRERAARFKDTLAAQGVTNPVVEALGYGKAYLPYDDRGDGNSLEARRNRRVEVYFVDPPQRR